MEKIWDKIGYFKMYFIPAYKNNNFCNNNYKNNIIIFILKSLSIPEISNIVNENTP